MKTTSLTAIIIRWIARVIGGFIIAFVGFFVLAHTFGESHAGEGFRNGTEIFMFICFPVCTLLGLIIAYWREGIGGAITVAAMVGIFSVAPGNPEFSLVLLPMLPGLLYLLYFAMTRQGKLRIEN